jgi:hypothetical protein
VLGLLLFTIAKLACFSWTVAGLMVWQCLFIRAHQWHSCYSIVLGLRQTRVIETGKRVSRSALTQCNNGAVLTRPRLFVR